MKRFGLASFVVVVLAAGRAPAQEDPTFVLGFSGLPCDGEEKGLPGSAYSKTIDLTLTTSNNPSETDGAQGWSYGLGVEGVTVESITIEGTTAGEIYSGGFQKSEPTVGEGNEGAVSAVVLSLQEPLTLPPTGTVSVAKVALTGEFPAENESTGARLFFAEGRRGSGQPVEATVTFQGGSVKPVLGECSFDLVGEIPALCPPPEGVANIWTIIQTENVVYTEEINAAVAPTPNGAELPGEIELAPGEGTVYIGIVSTFEQPSLQGWSLSIGVSGDIDVVGVTSDGTAADNEPIGYSRGGFEKTQVVDPALGNQGQGVVSAIVLSLQEEVLLPAVGTATVLGVTISGELDETGRIEARDNLRGAGQPVPNIATVSGGSASFACQQAANITFAAPAIAAYRHGEVNKDGRLDLSDPIYLVNALFRQGPAIECKAAADANDDSMVDLSDAVFILEYLWLSGTAPSFLECTVDETVSPEDCPAGSTACP
ncbi:MAG TPA: hypothetical protein VK116_05215 [Planctomycetota bacterium]|nr:hypothetical protein [Planctomycetota bacterium]